MWELSTVHCTQLEIEKTNQFLLLIELLERHSMGTWGIVGKNWSTK